MSRLELQRPQWVAQVHYLDSFGKERTGETKIFDSQEHAEQWVSLLTLGRNETATVAELQRAARDRAARIRDARGRV